MTRLTRDLVRKALIGFKSSRRREWYVRAIRCKFIPWAEEKGIKAISEITHETIVEYAMSLFKMGYRAHSVCELIYPICVATEVNISKAWETANIELHGTRADHTNNAYRYYVHRIAKDEGDSDSNK